jgi:hypothetical protein
MPRILRIAILTLALVAAAASWTRAQGGAEQKPPDPRPAAAAAGDAEKPAEPAQELPADAKAFNAAAGEKNPLTRVEALEKFIADNPTASPMLLSTAKSQITSSALAAFKDSRARYLALAEKDIADAAKRGDSMPTYAVYNNLASRLLSAGIFSEEAEDYARKGLAAMDERTYMESRTRQYERSLAAYEKMTASAPGAKAEAPPSGSAPTPPAPNYRFAMKDGVMQASLATPARPRPATPPRAPVQPTMPTEIEMRAGLKAERATALATLGQILMKRGKTDEGEKVLAEAYAARPASSTMASIARVLGESAKKAGNEPLQLEYLTVLALSGRITADENKDFEAAYRKTHNGSLDGLGAMLDERYRREHVRFAVTPFTRTPPAKPTGRAVLAEVFPGAG